MEFKAIWKGVQPNPILQKIEIDHHGHIKQQLPGDDIPYPQGILSLWLPPPYPQGAPNPWIPPPTVSQAIQHDGIFTDPWIW